MSNVPWPDEAATAPIEHVPARELARHTRIARLASLALERLMVAPDGEAIDAAVSDLMQIRALAEQAR
jgi:hypothetical protein